MAARQVGSRLGRSSLGLRGLLGARAIAAGRRGATALEMAVVAPLVLTLIFGICDLGIAVYAYNTMADAVRAGTRYAIVHGSQSAATAGPASNDSGVERVVRSYSPGVIASEMTVTSSWPDGNNAPGSRVTVAATYNYKPAASWFVGFMTVKLTSTSTMVISH